MFTTGKKIKILTAAMVMTVLMSGCQIGNKEVVFTTGLSSRDLFKINGEVCSVKEAKVYLINYQNIYGTEYGIDLWRNETCSESLESYIKDLTVSEISKIICMDFLAEEKGIELDETEQTNVEKAASAYYDSLTSEEKSYTGASESDIKKLYENYALAKKVYNSLTEGVNEEVSDDEARVMELMQIYVSDKETADAVQEKLDAGSDFASVASNYNEATEIEITVARGDLPEAVETAAFALDDEEVSSCVETEDGYYFIKCVNKFDQDLTDENKVKIVEKREKEAFDDEYNALIETFQSSFNDKAWDKIEIEIDDDITTDSFFTVFDQYCGA